MRYTCLARTSLVSTLASICMASWAQAPALKSDATPRPVTVEVKAEKDAYTLLSPGNGSGPLWSYGCSNLIRHGDDVLVCQMETGPGVPILNNTRWRLLRSAPNGWDLVAEEEEYAQREPGVMGVLSDGTALLYVNDGLAPQLSYNGRAWPHLLAFPKPYAAPGRIVQPEWHEDWATSLYFTEHSYRGFAVDSARDQILMLNIEAKKSFECWTLLDKSGARQRSGKVEFPIRACYPQVALKNGAAHVLAVGDIVEPIQEWREYKFAQTQQHWDYVFRILYYSQTPNVAAQEFAPPIEIANVDATGGHITNQDLWISPDGLAFVMYSQVEVASELMRAKFFPEKPVTALRPTLYLAILKDGAVIERKTLLESTDTFSPGTARFHEAADGALYAVLYTNGADAGNKLMQVYPLVEKPVLTPIPLAKPLGAFCLASVRAGNKASNTIDMLGSASGDLMAYACVEIR